ncbi:hypothetical protein BMF94_4996 [Rhodotorula taiwanensis]|uniref:Uncharacterized protein n=1 Tax=Rhodotorula taiwanensis TaxID=741276 RepID=A0A2S5B5D7_9BASI|nr:hypothetical protein BMF94_4996 [Rhodotorula taiwanensis]
MQGGNQNQRPFSRGGRGGRGGPRGGGRGGRGGRGNFAGNNPNKRPRYDSADGNGGSPTAYFSEPMLQDPWAHLS